MREDLYGLKLLGSKYYSYKYGRGGWGGGVRYEAYLIIQASIFFIWYPKKIFLVNKKIVTPATWWRARLVFFLLSSLSKFFGYPDFLRLKYTWSTRKLFVTPATWWRARLVFFLLSSLSKFFGYPEFLRLKYTWSTRKLFVIPATWWRARLVFSYYRLCLNSSATQTFFG